MFDMNSGYVGYSMSNRAVDAYENGEMPLSKWTKSAILEHIEYELNYDIEILKKLNKEELSSLFVRYSSWHHTSNMCNATNFYKIDEDKVNEFITNVEDKVNEILLKRVKRERKHKVIESPRYITALVSYDNWEGTRKHPKKVTYEEVVKFMSNDKIIKCNVGNKRLSSFTIIKKIEQKTKYADAKKVIK